MGILNLTPDSFFEKSRLQNTDEVLRQAEQMITDGADVLDIGAVSTRPFANAISEEEELERLLPALQNVRNKFPQILISIDTYRASVADIALKEGADFINDISAGMLDDKMFSTVAKHDAPYIMMHMQGTPANMQEKPEYKNVCKEVLLFLQERVKKAETTGIQKIIVDPGFGFGKTMEQNYELLNNIESLQILEKPILVGFSRKSMIRDLLNATTEDALNGTSVLNTIALMKGAKILRVHDVEQAVECVKIIQKMMQ